MRDQNSPPRRRPAFRLWLLLLVVGVVGLGIGLSTDPVWRARWFVGRGQPMRAWQEAILAPPKSARDRVLERAALGILESDAEEVERCRAADLLSCLAPVSAEAIETLSELAGPGRAPESVQRYCVTTLGKLAISDPRATDELLHLLGVDPAYATPLLQRDVEVEVSVFFPGSGGTRLRSSMRGALTDVGSVSLPSFVAALGTLVAERQLLLLSALEWRDWSDAPRSLDGLAQALAAIAIGPAPWRNRCAAARVLRRIGPGAAAALPQLGAAIDQLEFDPELLSRTFRRLLQTSSAYAIRSEEMQGEEWELHTTLEILACVRDLGRGARGIAPGFAQRLRREHRLSDWVPAMIMLYAAVEESPEVAVATLRRRLMTRRPLMAIPAALEILRIDPGDADALEIAILEVPPSEWERSLGTLHSLRRPQAPPNMWLPAGSGGTLPRAPLSAVLTRYPHVQVLRAWSPTRPARDAWGAMNLEDLLGPVPRVEELPLLHALLLRHSIGSVHAQALERVRRLAGDRAAATDILAGEYLQRDPVAPASLAAVAAAERVLGHGTTSSVGLLDRLQPATAESDVALLAILAGNEKHAVARRRLAGRLAEDERLRAPILLVLSGLVELARAEGRELEGSSFVALAEPWLHDPAVGACAGSIVFALRPQHPARAEWVEKLLEQPIELFEGRLSMIVPVMVDHPKVWQFARAIAEAQRTEAWSTAGPTPQTGLSLAEVLRVLEQRPNAPDSLGFRGYW